MSIKFIMRFAFWIPVTMHYQLFCKKVVVTDILKLQESKFEGYCCHEAWPQNEKCKMENKLDRHGV